MSDIYTILQLSAPLHSAVSLPHFVQFAKHKSEVPTLIGPVEGYAEVGIKREMDGIR
jgi:hypothetical protein